MRSIPVPEVELGALGRLAVRPRRQVPFVAQVESADCGIACLAMIARHHGNAVGLDEVRQVTGGSRGSDALALLRAAETLGMKGRGVRVEVADLHHLAPASILHWNFNHFVVADLRHATSNVAAERARAHSARGQLAGTRLLAPFAGQVSRRVQDPGATVARGEPIARILRDGSLVIRFAVPPERAHELGAGMEVAVAVSAVPTPLVARIARISPALDPASEMVIVEAGVDDVATLEALRPGLAATVTLP